MPTIDWRKTLTIATLFIALLILSVWVMRPSDEELASRSAQNTRAGFVPLERIEMVYDQRSWHMGREVKQDAKYSVDYLPQGDTLPEWKEIITIQAFGGIQDKGTPEEFALVMKKHISEWGGDKVTWNMISASDIDCIYEWQIKGKENFIDQYEIARIIKGSEGFHLVHYAKRTAVIDDNERHNWLERLKSAKLVQ